MRLPMKALPIAALFVVLVGAASPAYAQSTPPPVITIPEAGVLQELTLADGSRVYGRAERIDGSTFIFRTTGGATLRVDAAQVVALRTAEGHLVRGQ